MKNAFVVFLALFLAGCVGPRGVIGMRDMEVRKDECGLAETVTQYFDGGAVQNVRGWMPVIYMFHEESFFASAYRDTDRHLLKHISRNKRFSGSQTCSTEMSFGLSQGGARLTERSDYNFFWEYPLLCKVNPHRYRPVATPENVGRRPWREAVVRSCVDVNSRKTTFTVDRRVLDNGA